ncbi:MAG: RNA polymerase sigma factor [Actinomycetota bacterium]
MRLPPFQRFLDAHRDEVYRFLLSAVGPQDAEDCFQETFLAALRAYPRLSDASNLKGWILTIAHRKALDAHRLRSRRAVPVAAVPDEAGREPPDRDDGVWEAVRRLPSKQRAAVLLRFAADLPYREVARAAGGTAEAARRNVSDGLRTLRKEWSR